MHPPTLYPLTPRRPAHQEFTTRHVLLFALTLHSASAASLLWLIGVFGRPVPVPTLVALAALLLFGQVAVALASTSLAASIFDLPALYRRFCLGLNLAAPLATLAFLFATQFARLTGSR
jgi:hypothetical protein